MHSLNLQGLVKEIDSLNEEIQKISLEMDDVFKTKRHFLNGIVEKVDGEIGKNLNFLKDQEGILNLQAEEIKIKLNIRFPGSLSKMTSYKSYGENADIDQISYEKVNDTYQLKLRIWHRNEENKRTGAYYLVDLKQGLMGEIVKLVGTIEMIKDKNSLKKGMFMLNLKKK